MSEPKLTPWFSGDIKPVRVGVYQRKVGLLHAGKYRHWNGSYWGGWAQTPANAEAMAGMMSADQISDWRGLAADPAEKTKGAP